jgi:hypothetical protein
MSLWRYVEMVVISNHSNQPGGRDEKGGDSKNFLDKQLTPFQKKMCR